MAQPKKHNEVNAGIRDGFSQFARTGRWGTCADCPRVEGHAFPEFCQHRTRYDHNLTLKDLATAYRRDIEPDPRVGQVRTNRSLILGHIYPPGHGGPMTAVYTTRAIAHLFQEYVEKGEEAIEYERPRIAANPVEARAYTRDGEYAFVPDDPTTLDLLHLIDDAAN
jgi:hypothetical protein